MRCRLVDDTAVHAADLDEAEADWLSRRVRSGDGVPLAAAFGLVLERRSEGAAFVVPDEAYRYPWQLGPLPFPASGTVAHAALLVCDHAGSHGTLSGGPGAGWNGLTEEAVLQLLREHADANTAGKGGWSSELAADPERLAARVADLLEGLNLLRILPATTADVPSDLAHGVWWIAPTSGRWAMPSGAASGVQPTGARRTPRRVTRAANSDTLFDSEGERR